jgi:mannan endo-1,4-beta-mannosidase
MAWELANEPRPMRADAISDYTKWIDDASTLVKLFDKNHLVTTGAEGDMGTENIETFEAIHAFKNIDYLTIHIWPKNWGWFSDTAINKSFTSIVIRTADYISRHSQVAIRLDKPLVVEEFGLPRDLHSFVNGSGTNLRDNYYRTIFTMVNNSRKTKGVIAGCNFWGFGGNGRAAKNGNYWWSEGDDYLGDPPPEEQGLNSVFDNDTTTWELITTFTKQFK